MSVSRSVVFAIFDSKMGGYMQPFCFPNAAVAVRWFKTLVMDKENDISRFAEDYTLFELGFYEAKDASFALHNTPQSVVKALVLKEELARG